MVGIDVQITHCNYAKSILFRFFLPIAFVIMMLYCASCSGDREEVSRDLKLDWESAIVAFKGVVENMENKSKSISSLTIADVDEMERKFNQAIQNMSDKAVALKDSGYPINLIEERMGPECVAFVDRGNKVLSNLSGAVTRMAREANANK